MFINPNFIMILFQVCIKMRKGKLVLKEAPRVVSERDDRLLAESMNGIDKDSSESEDLSDA
jgi:hypothetical protein